MDVPPPALLCESQSRHGGLEQVHNNGPSHSSRVSGDTRLGGYRRGLLLPAAVDDDDDDDDDELASGRGCGAVWLTGLRAIIIIII